MIMLPLKLLFSGTINLQNKFIHFFMNCNLSIRDFFSLIKKVTLSSTCLSCNNLMDENESKICRNCLSMLTPTNRGNWVGDLTVNTHIDKVYSAWFFEDVIQGLIHGLKYNGNAKTGKILGAMTGRIFKDECSELDSLIPVPLHSTRARERGYNQAEWIARGLSYVIGVQVDAKTMFRTKNTKSQTTLTQDERTANMKNAFHLRKQELQENIALIDDVITTGSTVSTCAEILKQNGVKSVTVITVATPKLAK